MFLWFCFQPLFFVHLAKYSRPIHIHENISMKCGTPRRPKTERGEGEREKEKERIQSILEDDTGSLTDRDNGLRHYGLNGTPLEDWDGMDFVNHTYFGSGSVGSLVPGLVRSQMNRSRSAVATSSNVRHMMRCVILALLLFDSIRLHKYTHMHTGALMDTRTHGHTATGGTHG